MRYVVIGVLAFFLGSMGLLGQVSTGTILGSVKDTSGAVMPGANVTVRETQTNTSRSAVTGTDGEYRFDDLTIGIYEITAQANGFQTVTNTNLTLTVGQQAVSNFTLQVGSVSQTVSVSAEASNLVTTTSGSLSSLVAPQTIQDMPLNGRNYNDLTILQGGVTKSLASQQAASVGFSGTLFSSNGASLRSNMYMLDGGILVSASDNNGASAIGTTLGVDGIQEYRIITNNFDAEYGMVTGSQMLVVSKSGTNTFHGDAFEFLRNSALDARNYFDLPAYSTYLNGHRNPEFRRNQFGGALGGPIKKDKTFFFGVYEGLRAYLGVPELATTLGTKANPTGCQGAVGGTLTLANCPQLGATSAVISDQYMQPFLSLWPAPNLPGNTSNYGWVFPQVTPENYAQIRIDHTLSSSDSLFGRYTFDQSSIPYAGNFNEYSTFQQARNQFVGIGEDHIFSTSLVNAARVAFTREPDLLGGKILDPRLLEPQYVQIPANNLGMGGMSPAGVGTIGFSSLSPRSEVENLFTVADDLDYNRNRHSFKFGFIVNHYAERFITHSYDRSTFSFQTLATFVTGISTAASTVIPGGTDFTKYLNFVTMGYYAQDSWKATNRLTLNVGMRYEPVTPVNEIHGNTANFRTTGYVLGNPGSATTETIGNPVFKDESYRNWSPRFGFAWDVFGDGKTAVRGGFNLLYDLSSFGETYMYFAGYDAPFVQSFRPSNYSVTFGPLAIPVVLPAIGSFTPNYEGPVWNMAQPHLMSWNLTIERQLPGEMGLSVAYAGSKGLDLGRTLEDNNALPSGTPAVDSAGKTICALQPYGTLLNNANQFDGTATSCYAYNTNTTLQCGLLVNGTTPPQPGGPTPCYNRFNDALPSTLGYYDSATSIYNALDVNLTKRISHGLQLNAAYTWSRLLDNGVSGTSQEGQAVIREPLYPNTSSWGPESYDVTHVFHLSTIYRFPDFTSSKGFLSKVLSGWETTAILSLQTGYPFTALFSADHSNSGTTNTLAFMGDLPDVVTGRTGYSVTHGVSSGCGTPGTSAYVAPGTPLGTPKLWYDPCAFSVPAAGFIGTEGRGFLRGPDFKNLDFSLIKDTAVSKLGEAGKIEFRAEFFDLFNHPAFPLPGTTVAAGSCPAVAGDPNATLEGCAITPLTGVGTITSTIGNAGGLPGGQRQIQFGLKVMF